MFLELGLPGEGRNVNVVVLDLGAWSELATLFCAFGDGGGGVWAVGDSRERELAKFFGVCSY